MKNKKTNRQAGMAVSVLFYVLLSARALASDPAVWLDQVVGEWSGSQAELVWSVTEARNAIGFRIWRVEDEKVVSLNEQPVPINIFEPWKGVYRLPDPLQTKDSEAVYRMDAVLFDGTEEVIGNWTVRFEEPKPAPMAMPAAVQAKEPMAAAETPSTGPALKVPVISNDVYAVAFSDIAAGLGWSEGVVSNAVVTTNLAMRCGDSPVSYLADPGGQQILFYGWPVASNCYTRINYFWIEPGSGLQMQNIWPENIAVASTQTFSAVVDFEEEVYATPNKSILTDDLYCWDYAVVERGTSPRKEAGPFDVPLDGYASGDVTVSVRVFGWIAGFNAAEILFNMNKLGDVDCLKEQNVVFSSTIDAAWILPSGTNTLLMAPTLQFCIVDGFEVEYERFYEPVDGLLLSTDGGNGRLCATNFVNPLVLDTSDPYAPVWIADTNGVIPSGWSWSAASNTQWVMSEWSRIPSAVPQPAGLGAWLLDTTNAVDYLVIAPRAFEVPAQDLADYRASQGLRTAVVFYEDICDHFAGGLSTPEAIRSFLAYANQHWALAPWMVCLGGWGHYDYLGVMTPITSYLPALLGSDSATLRPADGLLADIFGNDGVPDLAIGRLPVQSVQQFSDYIAKVQAYEAGGSQTAHAQMLFVADDGDEGGNFPLTNIQLADETAARYTNSFSSLDSNSIDVVRGDIGDAFTNGFGIIHYTGHGSYKVLANENVFDNDDAAALNNPPVSVFISLTCSIGRYDIYSGTCLSENLMLNPNGGVLAVFSPSGLSLNIYASQYAEELYRLHTEHGTDTLGMLMLKARQSFGEVIGSHANAIRTYNLLGDPALKLQGGDESTPQAWAPNYGYWRWEKFAYDELTNSAVSGTSADPGGIEQGNLLEYVFGGYSPKISTELSSGQNVPVSWNQRLSAEDLTYQLLFSTNLFSGLWEIAPQESPAVKTPVGDGIMERVDVMVPFDGDHMFLKVNVLVD